MWFSVGSFFDFDLSHAFARFPFLSFFACFKNGIYAISSLYLTKQLLGVGAYGNSKMANLLFTFELNKRLAASSNARNITSVALHPGYTATNLQALCPKHSLF